MTHKKESGHVGLGLAKNVSQVHGAEGACRAVLRKKLRRTQVLAFSANFRDEWLRCEREAVRISGAVRTRNGAYRVRVI